MYFTINMDFMFSLFSCILHFALSWSYLKVPCQNPLIRWVVCFARRIWWFIRAPENPESSVESFLFFFQLLISESVKILKICSNFHVTRVVFRCNAFWYIDVSDITKFFLDLEFKGFHTQPVFFFFFFGNYERTWKGSILAFKLKIHGAHGRVPLFYRL